LLDLYGQNATRCSEEPIDGMMIPYEKGPAMSRAFSLFGPSCYLLLLLALGVGLITLLAGTLGMLLSTLRMLHALCVIALAVLISGGAVRLCSIFVEFGGFVVIDIRHVRFLEFSAQCETRYRTVSRSRMSRNGVAGMLVVPFGTWAILPDKAHQRTSDHSKFISWFGL
jgi:hypothetical protein